jgi:hypothetical protein
MLGFSHINYHRQNRLEGTMIPLYAMDGAQGERRYSSYYFLTLIPEGGQWSTPCPDCTLPLGKGP